MPIITKTLTTTRTPPRIIAPKNGERHAVSLSRTTAWLARPRRLSRSLRREHTFSRALILSLLLLFYYERNAGARARTLQQLARALTKRTHTTGVISWCAPSAPECYRGGVRTTTVTPYPLTPKRPPRRPYGDCTRPPAAPDRP